jgi:LysM repeat protein
MNERGLPIVDGAPACPFVAFEDDRDARSTGPDHRHRCYAEVRAAPRALAHQEAYCLSSAFPACPTFQDWARREAAAARPTDAAGVAGHEGDSGTPADSNRRNPPRDWAAPPPWLTGARPTGRGSRAPLGGALDAESDESLGGPAPAGREAEPVVGAGLSGSFADRIVSGPGDPSAEPFGSTEVAPGFGAGPAAAAPVPGTDPAPAGRGSSIPRHLGPGGMGRERTPDRPTATRPADPDAPPWERPRRFERYPTLRSGGLAGIGGSSVLIGFVAVVIAAVGLFFLPTLLGIGDDQPVASATPAASASAGPSPSPTAPSASLGPTQLPEPTTTVYVVQPGDTMSKIADKFGISLGLLIEANKETIPDPDKLNIGDEVIIPAVPPTSIPGASEEASAAP